MFDLLANTTVAGLSVVSARVLEQYNWFQRLAPETKRLIAVAIAAFIALAMHMISAIAQNAEPQSVIFNCVGDCDSASLSRFGERRRSVTPNRGTQNATFSLPSVTKTCSSIWWRFAFSTSSSKTAKNSSISSVAGFLGRPRRRLT